MRFNLSTEETQERVPVDLESGNLLGTFERVRHQRANPRVAGGTLTNMSTEYLRHAG